MLRLGALERSNGGTVGKSNERGSRVEDRWMRLDNGSVEVEVMGGGWVWGEVTVQKIRPPHHEIVFSKQFW